MPPKKGPKKAGRAQPNDSQQAPNSDQEMPDVDDQAPNDDDNDQEAPATPIRAILNPGFAAAEAASAELGGTTVPNATNDVAKRVSEDEMTIGKLGRICF